MNRHVTAFVLVWLFLVMLNGCSEKTYEFSSKKRYVKVTGDFPRCSKRINDIPKKFVSKDRIFYSFCDGRRGQLHIFDGMEFHIDGDKVKFERKIYENDDLQDEKFRQKNDFYFVKAKEKYLPDIYFLDIDEMPNVGVYYIPSEVQGSEKEAVAADLKIYVNLKNSPDEIEGWINEQATYMPQKIKKTIKNRPLQESIFSMLDAKIHTSDPLVSHPLLDKYWSKVEDKFVDAANDIDTLRRLHQHYPKFLKGTLFYLKALFEYGRSAEASRIADEILEKAKYRIDADNLAESVKEVFVQKSDQFDRGKREFLNKLKKHVSPYGYHHIVTTEILMALKEGRDAEALKRLKDFLHRYNPEQRSLDQIREKSFLQTFLASVVLAQVPLDRKIWILNQLKDTLKNTYFEDMAENIDAHIQTCKYEDMKYNREKLLAYLQEHPNDQKAKAYLSALSMDKRRKTDTDMSLQTILNRFKNEGGIENYALGSEYDRGSYKILKRFFASNNIDLISDMMSLLSNKQWSKLSGKLNSVSGFSGGIFGGPSISSKHIDYVVSNPSLAIESGVSKEVLQYMMDQYGLVVNFKSPYKSKSINGGTFVSSRVYDKYVENPVNTAVKYKRYDLLPILANPKYFKKLDRYPAGYTYLDKEALLVDTMMKTEDPKAVKIVENGLNISIDHIFNKYLDDIYTFSLRSMDDRIAYAEKFTPFISQDSLERLSRIKADIQRENKAYEAKSHSPCVVNYKKCVSYCKGKNSKNGSFLSSSDKDACVKDCSLGKIKCEEGNIEDAKYWMCSGICSGMNKYNVSLFHSSSYDECINNCKVELWK